MKRILFLSIAFTLSACTGGEAGYGVKPVKCYPDGDGTVDLVFTNGSSENFNIGYLEQNTLQDQNGYPVKTGWVYSPDGQFCIFYGNGGTKELEKVPVFDR